MQEMEEETRLKTPTPNAVELDEKEMKNSV